MDQTEFVAERNAFERVAVRSDTFNIHSPEGAFIYFLGQYFDELQHRLSLIDSEKYNIIELSKLLPDIAHKSPLAFLYAYKVTKNGRLSKSTLLQVSNELTYNLTVFDIIRYSRLILSLTK